nr:nicotinate-nucleotide adenylyltransferase [Nakamurella flava]
MIAPTGGGADGIDGRAHDDVASGLPLSPQVMADGNRPGGVWSLGSRAAGGRPRRRIGVMGGTFDPIHHGHLVAASEVADRFALDEVVFVPTGQPWQKTGTTVAEHRYLMTVIATASNPRFTVSRVDIDRPGPTYTRDTLVDLRRQEPDADWFFITGADALAAIMGWKNYEELFDLAHFIGVTRPGYQLSDLNLPSGAVTLIEVPALAISSTDCRRRVQAGGPVWYLVPDGVVQYIAKHGLYAGDGGPAGESAVDQAAPGAAQISTLTATKDIS